MVLVVIHFSYVKYNLFKDLTSFETKLRIQIIIDVFYLFFLQIFVSIQKIYLATFLTTATKSPVNSV